MKSPPTIALAALLFATFCLFAAEKPAAGPKGGRLLKNPSVCAEFFVNTDRKVEITFYDANLKPVSPQEQTVEAIAEAKDSKTTLKFEKKGDVLVSTTPLPAGHGFQVVVRLTPKSGEKTQNFRVPFHEGLCKGCNRAEYACICDHHDEGDGHGHHH